MSQQSLSPLKQALAAIDRLQGQLDRARAEQREAIAVIGLGLRLPGGVEEPQSFWDFLLAGGDAVTPVPADRWDGAALFDPDPDAAGKLALREGAFLDRVQDFDPAFFGLTADETAVLDPQQRLVLEVAWRTLEDAAIAPDGLAGSATGVYLGIAASDWRELAHSDPAGMGAFSETGSSHSVAAGRLSYLLDLKGPAISVDTACSSSLVAVHQALRALRAGDCDLALAGGVSLMLSPEGLMGTSRMRLLSPSGRCRAFDANGDGVALGEGAGMVALKRLSDAQAAGDRILGLIRGSALNHDGRSNGLTAPNGPSQVAVIRRALAEAGVRAEAVGFVETHGTGTALGDPIELDALAATYGQRRQDGKAGERAPDDARDRAADEIPCVLGAVKSNYGHLAAAAGVVGLIKALLVLRKGVVPANLHFERLNPNSDLAGTRLQLAGSVPLVGQAAALKFAAVSSFGWSGTNAHLVLQGPEKQAADNLQELDAALPEGGWLLPFSAKTPEALAALRQAWRAWLGPEGGGRDQSLAQLCATAIYGRQHFARRAVAWGRDRAGLRACLRDDPPADSAPPLAQDYLAGRPCDWSGLYGRRRDGILPGYPWQRQTFAALRRPAVPAGDPAGDISGDPSGAPYDAGALARRLRDLPLGERKPALLLEIRRLVAGLIGAVDEGAVPPDSGFFQLGMTSLGAVSLHKKLEGMVGRDIPRTLAFQTFTSVSVVDYLADGPLAPLFASDLAAATPDTATPDIASELEAALARLAGGTAEEQA